MNCEVDAILRFQRPANCSVFILGSMEPQQRTNDRCHTFGVAVGVRSKSGGLRCGGELRSESCELHPHEGQEQAYYMPSDAFRTCSTMSLY